MILKELLKFDDIVIQCHDFPDADTIASGFGIYCYLLHNGKNPRLIYSGRKRITKPNLLIMTEKLGIPIEYVEDLPEPPQLLITADCVYGESNVTPFKAEKYAAVDHHASVHTSSFLYDIRPSYGSCSSIIAVLLKDAGFDYNENENLSTALYYGLYTDSDEMKEVSFPADRDLRDFAEYNRSVFTLMINSNLSVSDLTIAGKALENINFGDKHRYAAVCTEECDPNILGVINDLIITADTVDISVVCCPVSGGIKFSVRSCTQILSAAELAEYIAENIGNGGGGIYKAGGFINMKLAAKHKSSISADDPIPYLCAKISDYFECFDVIDSKSFVPDISVMKKYIKIPCVQGVVKSTDIFKVKTEFCIRTIEADFDINAAEDIYIMINDDGSIYPIKADKFESTYTLTDDCFNLYCEYSPNVIAREYGQIGLLPYVKSCISSDISGIYAMQLNRRIKLYTHWDKENYMSGKAGDYLAVRTDDISDIYIITKDQFNKKYRIDK